MADTEDSPLNKESANEPAENRSNLTKRLRSRIVAGLVVVVPIWITVVVIRFVFGLLRDTSLWLIEALLLTPFGEPLLATWGLDRAQLARDGMASLPLTVHWFISLASVVLTIVIVYVLGAVAANVVGRRMIWLGERVVDRVPLAKVIYYASKNVLETFAGGETRPFQRVVLVPFPSRELASLGFVTHVGKDMNSGETLYTVFVAMAPHLTGGFVFVTPASDVTELDWTVEKALKVIISGGICPIIALGHLICRGFARLGMGIATLCSWKCMG